MKNTNKIYEVKKAFLLSFLLMFTFGCDDFLEKEPLDKIASNAVFESEGYAEAFLMQIYNWLPIGYGDRGTDGREGGGYGWFYTFSSITDEGRNKSSWPDAADVLVPGLISPQRHPWNNWSRNYFGIRKTNEFLDEIYDASFEEDFINRTAAEVRYIRAYLYFDLTRRFGNVPLITALPETEDDILVGPTSQAEIYQFIDDELTAIADFLPSMADLRGSSDYGRITKEAAWAFNGRALLFAEKFARSAEFSKKVMDSGVFALHPDYGELFQLTGGGSDEIIFEIMFKDPNKRHSFEADASPVSFGGGSQHNPTQELVDAYEMANGLAISDPMSGYDPQDPYTGRENRFYATINYHGASYRGDVMDMTRSMNGEGEFIPTGKDAPFSSGLHTTTGYYLRKFTNIDVPIAPKKTEISWKEFRYGEVLLNYAEAQNTAAGPDASVYAAMNEVRERAGLPGLTGGLSKTEMMDRIEQERFVELAWENHRYWDLIRWRKAVEVLNGNKFTGMFANLVDEVNGTIEYERFELDKLEQVFLEKHYLMPIPQSAIDKNNLLVQNEGY